MYVATVNQTRLDLYLAAEAKILSGAQSVQMGDRQFSRGNLLHIREEITRLQQIVAREQRPAGNAGFSQANFGD